MAGLPPITRLPSNGVLGVHFTTKAGVAELIDTIKRTPRTLVLECQEFDGGQLCHVVLAITEKSYQDQNATVKGYVTIGGQRYSVTLRTFASYGRANIRFGPRV